MSEHSWQPRYCGLLRSTGSGLEGIRSPSASLRTNVYLIGLDLQPSRRIRRRRSWTCRLRDRLKSGGFYPWQNCSARTAPSQCIMLTQHSYLAGKGGGITSVIKDPRLERLTFGWHDRTVSDICHLLRFTRQEIILPLKYIEGNMFLSCDVGRPSVWCPEGFVRLASTAWEESSRWSGCISQGHRGG